MTRDVRDLLRSAAESGPRRYTGARAAMERGLRLRWRRRLQVVVPLAAALVLAFALALAGPLRVFQIGDIAPTGPGEGPTGGGERVDATPNPQDQRTDPGAQGQSKGGADGPAGAPAAGAPGAGDAAVTSPAGGRIAFVSKRDGNTEIYTMDTDGGDQRRLTNSLFADDSPTWSPDGSRIAFSSNRSGDYEIYTMRADGSDVRRVGRVDGEQAVSPVWSPDGQRFAFVSFEDKTPPTGMHRIWVMNVDGSEPRALTHSGNELTPAWSPDGRRVSYWGDGWIQVVDVDGTNRRWLHEGGSAAWSPDGDSIAFVTGRDDSRRQALVVMNSDGTGVRALFETTDEWLGHPSWSADGAAIAFDRDPDGHGSPFRCSVSSGDPDCISSGQQPSAIWLIGADGQDLRRLSGDTDDYDATFSWASR